MNFKIDKTNWKKVKLDDVIYWYQRDISNKKQQEEGIHNYVVANHIDGDQITFKRFGVLADGQKGPTVTKHFEKGDLLLSTRSVALRKAAIASISGVTGEKLLVLRTKKESAMISELLPFVLHTNQFWKYAQNSASGSVNKFTSWTKLKEYEFLLPPKDQQAQLAELLRAMDATVEKQVQLFNASKMHYEVEKNGVMTREIDKTISWSDTTIGHLLSQGIIQKIQDGNHGEIHPKSSDYTDEGIPFVMANTLINGEIDFDKAKKIPKEKTDKLRIGFALPGDLLLSHKGTVGEVAIVPDNLPWPYLMLTPQVTYYRLDKLRLLNKFLYYVFTSNDFQLQLSRMSTQSTRAYVGITAQRNLKVMIPNKIEDQSIITKKLMILENNLLRISDMINTSKSLQKSLINLIF